MVLKIRNYLNHFFVYGSKIVYLGLTRYNIFEKNQRDFIKKIKTICFVDSLLK